MLYWNCKGDTPKEMNVAGLRPVPPKPLKRLDPNFFAGLHRTKCKDGMVIFGYAVLLFIVSKHFGNAIFHRRDLTVYAVGNEFFNRFIFYSERIHSKG